MLLYETVAVVAAVEGQSRQSQDFFGCNMCVMLAWPCCAFGRWFPITAWHRVIKKSINSCVCACQKPTFPKFSLHRFSWILFSSLLHIILAYWEDII